MLSLSDKIINLVGLIWYKIWKIYTKHQIGILILGIILVGLILACVLYFSSFGISFNLLGIVIALISSATIVLFFWVFTVSWGERKK